MTRKLYAILLSAVIGASAHAQAPGGAAGNCASFAPVKGQWEVSLVLGKSGSFYNENTTYLLPDIGLTGGNIGLPNGGVPGSDGTGSGYLNGYLNIDGFNGNSLVDIVGVQGKYFWQDCWSVSLSAGMNIGITPRKDYIEPTVIDMDGDKVTNELPGSKYVNATATDNWYLNVGTERYFKTRNSRIFPYVGAAVGFQMAHVETREPYTGNMIDIDTMEPVTSGSSGDVSGGNLVERQVYIPAGRVGRMFALKGAAVAGVEYSIMPGMFLALEFQPLAYRYDVIRIAPQGFGHYDLCHHNIKIFDMPTLRIGFRF